LCTHCKIKIKPTEKIRSYILERFKSMPAAARTGVEIQEPLLVYGAKGCEICGFTGYVGRAGLFEVLSMTDELGELIQKTPLESLIYKIAQKQGMLTMEQEGILKVLKGQTTTEEVARATTEKE
jgi:type II secretory ATPase GspE/PulE/Tfp pilus assembly ATPase PilB-like protein